MVIDTIKRSVKTLINVGRLSVPKNRITPKNISAEDVLANTGLYFVFGSNLDGNHAGGAASFAKNKLGAVQGQATGYTGCCYAIPTVGHSFMTMSLESIQFYVQQFIWDAEKNDFDHFLVTPIGCGIAGFTPEEIAPMFRDAMKLKNVSLPQEFWDVLLD